MGQAAPIRVEDERVGVLEVFYREETVHSADGPFLKEECKLLEAIADRLGRYLEHAQLRQAFQGLDSARDAEPSGPEPWRVILDFLRRTDEALLVRVSRKLINHLGWLGVAAAVSVLHEMNVDESPEGEVRPPTISRWPGADPTRRATASRRRSASRRRR